MTQPRSMNGRFASSGGDQEPDPLNEWLSRQKWWVVALAVAALVAFMLLLYYSGYILVFIIGAFALSLVLPLLAEPLALVAVVAVKLWRWVCGLCKKG